MSEAKSNEEEKEKNTILFRLIKWAERTSIHAIPMIAINDNILIKFVWTIFFLVFVALNGWFVYTTVAECKQTC